MSKIVSSKLITYNANVRGTDTGDCTARAISLAFNMDYSKTRKALNDSAKSEWRKGWKYNNIHNCSKIIKEFGGSDMIRLEQKVTVGEFADTHSGTHIIWCSRTGGSNGPSHLVCVIDDRIYDSWNSTNYKVIGYWVVESGISSSDITDIGDYLKEWANKDYEYWSNYANAAFDKIIDHTRKLKKLADEYGVDFRISLNTKKIELEGYTFSYWFEIGITVPEYNQSFNTIKGKFSIAFKPTLTTDKVDEYFNKAFYTKFYDFIQNHVVSMLVDFCEGYKFLSDASKKSGIPLPPDESSISFWDKQTLKSFNSLPYWVRRLTVYFNAENPLHNDYSDRVELEIKTPPFDTKYGEATETSSKKHTRYFHAYNVSDLKDGLELYKKTGDYEAAYARAADW